VIGIVAGRLQGERIERGKYRLRLFAFGFEIQNFSRRKIRLNE
jgi:hypothetical protein